MRLFLSLLLTLLVAPAVFATHILGGYIQTAPIAGQANAQRITIFMYYDLANGNAAAASAQTMMVCFGDGAVAEASRATPIVHLNNGSVSSNRYVIDHVYSGPGVYQVQATALSRTDNLRNINNGSSLNVSFAVRTTVQVGLANQTPTLAFPTAALLLPLNQRVSVSLAATDAEGDSLSYAFALPLVNHESNAAASRYCTSFSVVAGYQFPNDVRQVGTYRLNARTGLLTWDVPTEQGRYAADILVSEWRGGALISQTQEEIILVVMDQGGTPVAPPTYEPAQLATITATAPIDRDALQLTVWPNPSATGEVLVGLKSIYAQPAMLQLTDGQGRIRQTAQLLDATNAQHRFDVSNLPAGTYLISAESNGHRVVKKVVRP